jgi:hypothetical protein
MRRIINIIWVILIMAIPGLIEAQSSISVSVDTKSSGKYIEEAFCGLSYEIKLVLPDSISGKHYFSPGNKALISAFRTLGIKHLRVGGNTADRPTVKIPGRADIDSLFAFAKAAGVKVIYTVRLKDGNPNDDAVIAKYIMDNYKNYLYCLTIGNEPNMFSKDYQVYLDEWKKFATIIKSAAPDIKFCGPSATPGKVDWAGKFANDLGSSEFPVVITQHDYPGKAGNKVTADTARTLMLSPAWHQVYQKFHDSFVPAVLSNGLTYRLEEANSYYNGGAVGASDTYTSALWVLDYLYWWASHNASGINFHTGEKAMPGGKAKPNAYAAFSSVPGGFVYYPIAYGMKTFTLGGQGKLVPANVVTNSDSINLTAYSTFSADKSVYITLINKEFGVSGRSASVKIDVDRSFKKSEIIYLKAPKDDITSVKGVTLGGAEIKEDGSWKGKWEPINMKDQQVTVNIPVATALVIKLY